MFEFFDLTTSQAAREEKPSCAHTRARSLTGDGPHVPLVAAAADLRAAAILPSGSPMARRATDSSARGPEERCVPRHKVMDAGRRLASDRLDIVRQAIIAVGGMEVGHGQQMLENVIRQLAAAQLLVPPLLQGDIHI